MMYKFSKLEKRMNSWGFPRIDFQSGFKLIRTDFEKEYKAGNIRFGDDGVYLEREGNEYRGYMFIKEPYIERYNSYPKFHLTRCQTIDEFIRKGKFKIRYEWSNSNINDLIDKTSRKIYKDEILQYCWFCKQQIFADIEDTEDFYSTLDTDEIEKSTVEIDIFGYDKDWQKISRLYRKKANYTCENCGLKITNRFDYRFLHTHHINGNKETNTESNLKCLCPLCHSQVDKIHKDNFNKNRMRKDVQAFTNKYRDELKKINNPYL
jgi:predicted HNH restriction endonuclease